MTPMEPGASRVLILYLSGRHLPGYQASRHAGNADAGPEGFAGLATFGHSRWRLCRRRRPHQVNSVGHAFTAVTETFDAEA